MFAVSKPIFVSSVEECILNNRHAFFGYVEVADPGQTDVTSEIEASSELRKIAMKFMSYVAAFPRIKYKKVTHNELDSIGPKLIRLSNSIGNKSFAERNCQEIEALRRLLYKNNPDAL